jgi:hypothetical protein
MNVGTMLNKRYLKERLQNGQINSCCTLQWPLIDHIQIKYLLSQIIDTICSTTDNTQNFTSFTRQVPFQ